MFLELWIYEKLFGKSDCCVDKDNKGNRIRNAIHYFIRSFYGWLFIGLSLYLAYSCNINNTLFNRLVNMALAGLFSFNYLLYYIIKHLVFSFDC